MKFILHVLLSRMRRSKLRLFFVLLAIVASSCLIVWTIGGFQALFIDETTRDAQYLGRYDLRISLADAGAGRGAGGGAGGGTFASPLSRETYETRADASDKKKEKDSASSDRPSRGGRRGDGGRGGALAVPSELAASIRADESVSVCDATTPLRMFVYSPGIARFILEDEDADDEGAKPTYKRSLDLSKNEELGEAGSDVDFRLRRKAYGAYRATMGTPFGMGSTFYGTTALESPYELEEGRWFDSRRRADGTAPREAVLTTKGAEQTRAKPGDALFLIGTSSERAVEYQLEVVGIANDPETDGFYISDALAREISDASGVPLEPNALYLNLRGDVDSFRARWNERLSNSTPALTSATRAEIASAKEETFKRDQSFKYQAASGTVLAALASLLIVFTALNTSVDEHKRLIAFYRVSGMTRGQTALSILIESAILSIPGWCAGMAIGWTLVRVISGKSTGLNGETIGFSFLCTVVGAILASLYPMARAVRVRPLEALGRGAESVPYLVRRRRSRRRLFIATALGFALVAFDVVIVHLTTTDTATRAAIHSALGTLALALGTALIIPLTIVVTEAILTPIFARVARFDPSSARRELSGNAGRVTTVAIALSVGGGLFVTMQIWGYSMLDPFLPGRVGPDAFAAFLPNGLREEKVAELRALPFVDPDRFVPIAVDQAAFVEGSVPDDARKKQFANVVFFGVDVDKAFGGKKPLVAPRFRQGDPKEAFFAMKSGRGVIVTDSLTIDYGLRLGDALKVAHPREPGRVLEYPIVGVVSFPGWQWLSKTGGVRRNFGRSGGIAFAREDVVASDFELDRRSYFWFDAPKGTHIDYRAAEDSLDELARDNLTLDKADQIVASPPFGAPFAAYAKLSTRESLTNSITRRADKVIWGLSKTPLTTLAIAAIAAVGAIANSVRARRWRYGVMRALGATRGALVRMILVEGAMIGIVASSASFFFGFVAAQGALKLGRSLFGSVDPPLILPYKGLTVGFGLTLALCLCAALYPAIKTGRTEILKLLQSGRAPD